MPAETEGKPQNPAARMIKHNLPDDGTITKQNVPDKKKGIEKRGIPDGKKGFVRRGVPLADTMTKVGNASK